MISRFIRLSAVLAASILAFHAAFAAAPATASPSPVPSASASAPQAASPAKEQTKEGSRIEQLFIWKTSEELRLPPDQELKFSETIHALNARRHKAMEAMDQTIQALSSAKTKADSEKLTATYKKQLREIQAIQIAELDQLGKVLGPEKLAQYLVVKNAITDKLKTLISK